MKTIKNTHGGKRKGAGRKTTNPGKMLRVWTRISDISILGGDKATVEIAKIGIRNAAEEKEPTVNPVET